MLRFAFILTFLFLLSGNAMFAQSADSRTIIHGKISYPLEFSVKLEYQDSPLLNPVVMETAINDESKYIFAVDIAEPQYLTLNHGKQKVQIYVTPASRMEMSFEGNDILNSITFSGENNHDNLYLIQQQKLTSNNGQQLDSEPFPVQSDALTMQFIENKAPEGFIKKISKSTEEKQTKLEAFNSSYPLSTSFYELQKNRIQYQDMISRLNYPYVNWGKATQYPDDYFNFTSDIDLNKVHAIAQNPSYQTLLYAYGNYLFSQHAPSPDASITDTYDLLFDQIEESSGKYFLLATLLVNDINEETFTLVDARKKHFYQNNPNKELSQIVESAYANKQRLEIGKPSPSFLLSKLDNENEKVSLYDYDGEIVFVSFWASTCPPCIANFKRTKQLKKEFSKKGVRFVNIALDEDRAACQDLIRRFNIDGVNLIAPEKYSEVKYAYKVFLLPGYFVIDANGNLTSLKGQPLDSIDGKLERLLRIHQEKAQSQIPEEKQEEKVQLQVPEEKQEEKVQLQVPEEKQEEESAVIKPLKNKGKKKASVQKEEEKDSDKVQITPLKNNHRIGSSSNFGMIKID